MLLWKWVLVRFSITPPENGGGGAISNVNECTAAMGVGTAEVDGESLS